MPTQYTFLCDETQSREIRRMARENNVTEEEVIRQLLDIGLQTVQEEQRI